MVLYEDGYIQIVPVAMLVHLHVRKELQDKQQGNPLMQSFSGGGVEEVWWKRVQWSVENDGLIEISRNRAYA